MGIEDRGKYRTRKKGKYRDRAMICEYCNKSLKRKKRFCSDQCRYLWWKEHPEQKKQYTITCKGCGTIFQTTRQHQLYCTIPCRNKANSEQYTENLNNKDRQITWACGGGVDSTAIAVLICQGVLPKPDFAYMINTRFEKQRTWQYVNNILIPNLNKVDIKLHIIPSLNANIIKSNQVVIPAYKRKEGIIKKLSTRCGAWKKPIAQRWLRRQGVKACWNWVGISADEAQRIKMSLTLWFQLAYPLIQLKISRLECKSIISKMGWPPAPRTSCFMCPQQSDRDWKDMKFNFPEDWKKAVAIDNFINNKYNTFLHGSCVPLDRIDFKNNGQKNDPNIEKFFDGSMQNVHITCEEYQGYQYGFISPDKNEIRLGFTVNPTARMKQHQHKYGKSLRLLFKIKSTKKNETFLHRKLNPYKLHNNRSFYKNIPIVCSIIDDYIKNIKGRGG